jgi:hypothetical protein
MSGLDQPSIGGAGRRRSDHATTPRNRARTGTGSAGMIRRAICTDRAGRRRISVSTAVRRPDGGGFIYLRPRT